MFDERNVVIASGDSEARARWIGGLRERFDVIAVGTRIALETVLTERRPGVLVLDVTLPGLGSAAELPHIRNLSPATRTIVLSDRETMSEGLSALLAGAKGYCARAIDPVSLDKAVASVGDGELWMRRALVNALVAELVARTGDAPNDLDKRPDRRCLERLTRRQREVAEAVAMGASNKEIARQLNVTERTVKAHLTEMFRNVGVRDRLRLALLLNDASGAPRQMAAAQPANHQRAPGAVSGNRGGQWPAGIADFD